MDEKLKEAIRHDLKRIAKAINKLIKDLDRIPDECNKSDSNDNS